MIYCIILNVSTLTYLLYVNHTFRKNKQNKFFCIVICYCELKLKWMNIMFVKNDKSPTKRVRTDFQGK